MVRWLCCLNDVLILFSYLLINCEGLGQISLSGMPGGMIEKLATHATGQLPLTEREVNIFRENRS